MVDSLPPAMFLRKFGRLLTAFARAAVEHNFVIKARSVESKVTNKVASFARECLLKLRQGHVDGTWDDALGNFRGFTYINNSDIAGR